MLRALKAKPRILHCVPEAMGGTASVIREWFSYLSQWKKFCPNIVDKTTICYAHRVRCIRDLH